MRQDARDSGVFVRAYAGVTGVLLAMNLEEHSCTGLLGFAIEREATSYAADKRHKWLAGLLAFPGQKHKAGELIPSNVAPIQKFRWSDYTVYPGTEYIYKVHPVYGSPEKLDIRQGPTVKVTIVVDFTTDAPVVISGSHNFSQPASSGNDENYLIIRGNRDVADYFGCELLRIYDHYRFRFVAKQQYKSKKAKAKGPRLTPDDAWTKAYFDAKDLKMTDRLRFTGL
jgi:hypothetical protein